MSLSKIKRQYNIKNTFLNPISSLFEEPVNLLKQEVREPAISNAIISAVADNMFRFWYRFVPENNSLIARGAVNVAYKRIEAKLSDYMGMVFEEICKESDVRWKSGSTFYRYWPILGTNPHSEIAKLKHR